MKDTVCIQPTFWSFKRSIVNGGSEERIGQSLLVSLLNAEKLGHKTLSF